MRYGRMFLTSVLAMSLFSGISYAGVAGVFRLPYDSYQQWPAPCASSTMGWKMDQIFMNLYSVNNQYHMAEDWNGKCGGSTDRGAVLYAIVDGVVQDANMDLAQGGFLLIRHPLPDGTSRYVLYEHILDIEVNPRTGAQFKTGDAVYIGDTIARLGDGNGYYVGNAHLHLEMRRSLFAKLDTNPYYNPLTTQTALLYSSPSLFIDDRRNAVVQNLPQGQWTNFYQTANAPGSTAYVEVNGLRLSLQRAAALGFIYQYVYLQKNGLWYYYPDITQVFFDVGNTYWIYAFAGGTRLNILVPGHNFKTDRAKIDMIHAVNGNSNFARVYTQYTSSWSDSSFDYLMMVFSNDNDSALRYSYVAQATSKANPLVRFTAYQDPITGSWTSWTQVNPNTLD